MAAGICQQSGLGVQIENWGTAQLFVLSLSGFSQEFKFEDSSHTHFLKVLLLDFGPHHCVYELSKGLHGQVSSPNMAKSDEPTVHKNPP